MKTLLKSPPPPPAKSYQCNPQRVYREGSSAGRAGRDPERNPFAADPVLSVEWAAGYIDGATQFINT